MKLFISFVAEKRVCVCVHGHFGVLFTVASDPLLIASWREHTDYGICVLNMSIDMVRLRLWLRDCINLIFEFGLDWYICQIGMIAATISYYINIIFVCGISLVVFHGRKIWMRSRRMPMRQECFSRRVNQILVSIFSDPGAAHVSLTWLPQVNN